MFVLLIMDIVNKSNVSATFSTPETSASFSTSETSTRLAASRTGISFNLSIDDIINKNTALKTYVNLNATFNEISEKLIACGYDNSSIINILNDKIVDHNYPPYPDAVYAFILYYIIMGTHIENLQHIK